MKLDLKSGRVLLGAVVTVLVWSPMIVGKQFFVDWVNSYWLILASQKEQFPQWGFGKASGLFILEPWQLFYGGNFYQLIAKATFLLNEVGIGTLIQYRLSYVILAVLVYYEIVRTSRVFAIKDVYSIQIALIYVSSPYFLTNAFGRGAYTEYAATCLFLLVSGRIIRFATDLSDVRLRDVLYFIVFLTLLISTHMVSLVLMFVFLSISILIFVRLKHLKKLIDTAVLHKKGTISVCLGVLCSLLFSGIQLWPAVLSQSGYPIANSSLVNNEFSLLTTVIRPYPFTPLTSTCPGLKTQIPILLALWAFGGLAYMSLKKIVLKGILIKLFVLFFLCLIFVTSSKIWTYLPDSLEVTQFSYRFITYSSISILLAALVLSNVLSNHENIAMQKMCISILVAVTSVCVLFGFMQTTSSVYINSGIAMSDVVAEIKPATWYVTGTFALPGTNSVDIPANLIVLSQTSRAFTGTLRCSDYIESGPIELPIANSRWLEISGIEVLGASSRGLVVAQFSKCKDGGEVLISGNIGLNGYLIQTIRDLTYVICSILVMLIYFIQVSSNSKKQER